MHVPATLPAMPEARKLKRGRPPGSRSFDPRSAVAFGDTVRNARTELGLSQDAVAWASEIERSHLSRIERGLSQPTLFAIMKLAGALDTTAANLVELTERQLSRRKR